MKQASFIATCVFNAFFGFTAITFNIVTILALRKPLTIPRAVKTLLLSQAVSDLGVGLLVHIGVRAGGTRGAAAPPNFGQLRFFWQREKIWAKPAF